MLQFDTQFDHPGTTLKNCLGQAAIIKLALSLISNYLEAQGLSIGSFGMLSCMMKHNLVPKISLILYDSLVKP